MNVELKGRRLFGTLCVPPSKSDSQRALLAASLSEETSMLYNLGKSDDELVMLRNCQLLGSMIKLNGDQATISGRRDRFEQLTLHVGESGLGLRLLAPVGLVYTNYLTIEGQGSLLKRSQLFVEQQFTDIGVDCATTGHYLPMTLKGKLNGGQITIDGSVSSQFLSGLLMALPLIEKDSLITVTNLKSIPYIQMTIKTLQEFGVLIEHDNYEQFSIKGRQRYKGATYAIESDWSAASCWLAAAAIGHQVKLVGLDPNSLQADRVMLEALVSANCAVSLSHEGITVDGSGRTAFQFDLTHAPDLFPALVALAAHCEGVSVLYGVNRLKHKESDRGVVLQKEFGKLGVRIELAGDEMRISGGTLKASMELDSHNDHRIAMCLAVATLGLNEKSLLQNAEAVRKSYPDFWEHFEELTIS